MTIQHLLVEAIEQGASDLHLTQNAPPILRIDGELEVLDLPPLTAADTQRMIYSLLNDAQKALFEEKWELDLSIEVAEVGRFRVNVHKQRGAVEAAFRVVSENIRTLRELGMPPVTEEIARRNNGLVLITGPTGSGKTTTLAAMIHQINNEQHKMIICVEDPIEYIHKNRKSIIKQREVTSDTKSFADALRHVLRQDPDVVVIGEMRDLETIATALTAAETGHLVLATLHTPDAVQTVDRIIDVFPPYQQQQVRIQLAGTLQAIIAQQLVPVPMGRGRVVATEILIATVGVRNIIRNAKTEQLYTVLQMNYELGMMTMDKSLKTLYQQGLISYDEAIRRCRFPEAFDTL
ncbi:MAG: type IV pilus twitching motility protein PilT [Candidatus Hydrogenedentota bacterium]|nr:MAG: type IV pilus twitching motility protein PilT [Candidatus Hydrogenedentota bacterium]